VTSSAENRESSAGASDAAGIELADVRRLHELGYAQELRRGMSRFSNFAVSFSIISVLTALTLYGYGMGTGGPADLVWGYLIVGLLVIVVGSGMAEICSAYPTSGGLYYWAGRLGGRHGAAWSWFTGWFNVLGQVAVTAGIDFGFATFFLAFLNLTTGWQVTRGHQLLLYGLVLLAHALLNSFGVRVVAFLSDVSAWWHLVGVAVITIVLIAVPAHHASAHYVFATFENQTGIRSGVYVFLIGLLFAQYNFTGYDASAHMTEETRDAARSGPRGIISSIVISLIAGLILMTTVTYATTNYAGALASATGVPPLQIFLDALGRHGGELLFVIVFVAAFYCGMCSVTANSRMIFAFSRDGALPGSALWHKINPRTGTPTNAVWLAAVAAFVLGIPSLWSTVAFGAITSIATIGLYISYVTPILLRRIYPRNFEPGPWHLGRWSGVLGWIAVVWVCIITVLFCLPEVNPVTWTTFNYAPIAVGAVLVFSGTWWLISARKWFTGPHRQGDEAQLRALEGATAQLEGTS
jgi:amino acid permease (GABA permease)